MRTLTVTPDDVECYAQPIADEFARRLHRRDGDRRELVVFCRTADPWPRGFTARLRSGVGATVLETCSTLPVWSLEISRQLTREAVHEAVPWCSRSADVATVVRALSLLALAELATDRPRARARAWFANGLPPILGTRRASGLLAHRTVSFRYGPHPDEAGSVRLRASAAIDPVEARRRIEERGPAYRYTWRHVDGEAFSLAEIRYPAQSEADRLVYAFWEPHLMGDAAALRQWADAPARAKVAELRKGIKAARAALATATKPAVIAQVARGLARLAGRPELAKTRGLVEAGGGV